MNQYLGQPNPGATIPLPITGLSPSPHGMCGCGKPADATYQRRFHSPQPVCAPCADRLGIPGVLDRSRLVRLPAEFRIEEAIRTLRWNGTGLSLARTLADYGYTRRRVGTGFTWYRREAA